MEFQNCECGSVRSRTARHSSSLCCAAGSETRRRNICSQTPLGDYRDCCCPLKPCLHYYLITNPFNEFSPQNTCLTKSTEIESFDTWMEKDSSAKLDKGVPLFKESRPPGLYEVEFRLWVQKSALLCTERCTVLHAAGSSPSHSPLPKALLS